MSEDFDVRQRTENIYGRWRSENNKKFSDKHSKEDGETLERFYNRINLDERRRKMLEDSKENHVPWRPEQVKNKKY
ncbi:MAG: hypothetical protein WA364_10860 [Candidatus Nitrosopolaris sp.]